VAEEKGGTQFVKDPSGQFVKSHLDESMLKQIAEATGAMYQPLGQQAQGLEAIYQKGLSKSRATNWLRACTRSISSGSNGRWL